jgi:Secretion system C-terminal sorting domain
MKRLSIFALAILCLMLQTNAQNSLELSWTGSWNPPGGITQGPTINPQTQSFQQDLSNYTLTPDANFSNYTTAGGLTVTTSLRNQVYTGFNYGSVSTGLSFGTQKSEWNDPVILTQAPNLGNLFDLMGANVGPYGPNANLYKTSSNGILKTIDADYSQFGNDGNGGVSLFSTVEPLQDLNLDKAGRYEYGELVITFSKPVKNPVIHISSLGGSTWYLPVGSPNAPGNWKLSYFTSELELQTPGVSSQLLSGTPFFNIQNNNILNSAARPNGDSQVGDVDQNGNSSFGAASGSVKIIGTVTELVYKVYVRGSSLSDFNFSFDKALVQANRDPFYGDYWTISYSLDKPTQQISGNVFNDRDGLIDNNINQSVGVANPKTNAGGLYANLIRNGVVVDTVAISPEGIFLFDNVALSGANPYTVQLSINKGTIGSVPPATALPTNWVNTGENGATTPGNVVGSDGTVNGISASITVAANDIKTEVNFGIQRLPESVDFTRVIPSPSIGTVMTLSPLSNLPVLTGSDPEDQPVSGTLSGKTVVLTNLPNNATLRYNGVAVVSGTPIPNYNPNLLTITFNGPAQAFSQFNYAYVDASGRPDPTPATYRLAWSGGPLAITLTDFTAIKNNCIAGLTWKTASEINASRFEIEVSNNSNAVYNKVGSLNATATNGKTYQFTYPMQAGTQYYFRLKMIDKDGSFKYSDVRTLTCDGKGTKITIAPNPVVDQFVISGMENGRNIISVFTSNGQLIKTQTIAQPQGYVKISNLAAGMYSVKIISEKGNVTVGKLIKN